MPSWMEERDRLMAQAQAFVQQVAAAHPRVSSRPEVEKLLADKAEAIEPAPSPPEVPAPVTPTADAILATRPIAIASTPPAARLPPVSERSDIQQRVAAFRACQARMNAEREAYYETMQAKIRRGLGNEPGSDRL
jgi:hypothetical protein